MWWTGCTRRLQKHMLGFWVTLMAAARRCWLFFLDSHPRHVTKGQVVFSVSSTAASPGCRCVCNPAGTATPVLIKTVEGTRRTAVVQSGALFSWRQPDFFRPLFFCYESYHTRVVPHCCVGTQGNCEVWPLFLLQAVSQRTKSLHTASQHSTGAWQSTSPAPGIGKYFSSIISDSSWEVCRPSVHCTVTETVLGRHFMYSENAECRNLFRESCRRPGVLIIQ